VHGAEQPGCGLSLQKVRTRTGHPCSPVRQMSKDLELTLLARVVGQPAVGQSHDFGVRSPAP
jgi:hypothetical protein